MVATVGSIQTYSDIFRLFIKHQAATVMRTSTASASGVNKGSKAKWSSPQSQLPILSLREVSLSLRAEVKAVQPAVQRCSDVFRCVQHVIRRHQSLFLFVGCNVLYVIVYEYMMHRSCKSLFASTWKKMHQGACQVEASMDV